MGKSPIEEDPLALAIAPPPDETPGQRELRERREAEARRISDEIDEQIRRERELEKKKKKPVKLLLLGQAEAGKTATLKNFQLCYARREWTEERSAWRSVIFLNLVRNVNDILQDLNREMQASSSSPAHNTNGHSSSDTSESSEDDIAADIIRISTNANTTSSSSKSRQKSKIALIPPLKWSEKHRVLALRLGPLRRIQTDLEQRLGDASIEPNFTNVTNAAPFASIGARDGYDDGEADGEGGRRALKEFSINSTNGWKSALDKFRATRRAGGGGVDASNNLGAHTGSLRKLKSKEDETTEVIAGCREDMIELWEDPVIKEMLARRKTRIEDSPGFFLADAERIAVRNYQATDDDIIRARLRTLGVQEYKFVFENGRTIGQEWRLYDVGGTRSSRAAWYPYFDDVDAIIFLAPISCFDEKLAEDRRVNRLEDSYLLWKSVCSCKLLARTQMILFLNKCDLLQAKLMRGTRVRDSVPSFGERKNDLGTVTKYFQQHFKEISKQYSPVPRTFYVHLTSVVDTRATAVTLGAVEESILRNHLRRADLM